MVLVEKLQFLHLFFSAIQPRKMCFTIFQNKKTNFYALKTTSLKSRNLWFLSKNGHFPTFFFQAIQARKMCFTIFQNEKTPVQAIKTRSSKSRKIDIFSKGFPWFCSKNCNFFHFFFFGNIAQENVFYDILEPENAVLGCKNKKFKQSKNCDFFKGVNPWFLSKNRHFSNFSFLAIQARKMCFTIFQNGKRPFQAIKTRSSKSPKIEIFPKGLTHGFCQKMAIFPPFFQAIQARKMCFTIFQNEKMPFQAIKTRSSKSLKIEIFPKGLTLGFGQKMAIFPLFFQAIQARKMCFTIFQNEKMPFQAIKTRSSKSRKIDIFPKGLTHGFGPKMAIFHTFFFAQYMPGKCL